MKISFDTIIEFIAYLMMACGVQIAGMMILVFAKEHVVDWFFPITLFCVGFVTVWGSIKVLERATMMKNLDEYLKTVWKKKECVEK